MICLVFVTSLSFSSTLAAGASEQSMVRAVWQTCQEVLSLLHTEETENTAIERVGLWRESMAEHSELSRQKAINAWIRNTRFLQTKILQTSGNDTALADRVHLLRVIVEHLRSELDDEYDIAEIAPEEHEQGSVESEILELGYWSSIVMMNGFGD